MRRGPTIALRRQPAVSQAHPHPLPLVRPDTIESVVGLPWFDAVFLVRMVPTSEKLTSMMTKF